METTLKNAYTEVNEILNILGYKYQKQIPKQVLMLFKDNINPNYKTNISKQKSINEMNISRTALIIISILNFKYWEKDKNRKNELENIYQNNELKYQEKINVYKNEDWLKTEKNSDINLLENNTEKSLIKREKYSIFKLIINKIKKIFQK